MQRFCKKHHIDKIIVDGRDQESMTDVLDSFEFGRNVPSEMSGLTIAVVRREDDESLQLIETVAFNRGSDTRAFLSIDEARAWLESLEAPG